MSEFIVKKNVTMRALPSEVWEALTNPEKTKKYFFNCEVNSDWRAGAEIKFRGRLFFFKKIEMSGVIEKIEAGKLLQYTLKNRGGGHSRVIERITYENGMTTLTVSDDVGNSPGAEKRLRMSQKGWDKVLEGLKEMVEKESKTLIEF
jgi:uncharacterized protein YndB with AHSA1/START domain